MGGKGSVQQYFCTWKHAWRCHVLWKRSRQACTASAVVADVVEAAEHSHDTIPNNWSNEEMTYGSGFCRRPFFVRVKDTSLDEVDKAAGKVEAVIEPDPFRKNLVLLPRL